MLHTHSNTNPRTMLSAERVPGCSASTVTVDGAICYDYDESRGYAKACAKIPKLKAQCVSIARMLKPSDFALRLSVNRFPVHNGGSTYTIIELMCMKCVTSRTQWPLYTLVMHQ